MTFPLIKFTDIVQDKSGGNKKLPQEFFLIDGQYPVVDQSKKFIAGYINDQEYLVKSTGLPVVIFGDHTKAIKYVDFPFAMGADGVKVLKPKDECDTKYLYHYLRYAKIPDAGYSRHFKFLKELEIPLPPLAEQRRIASILDQADELRQKRQQAIEKLDQLLQATFIDMFGDPVSNPKGWDKLKIEDIASDAKYSIKAGPFGSALKKEDYVLHGYKIYGQEQVIRDDFEYGDYYITEEKYKSLENCSISSRDVLISLVGTFGKISVVPDQFEAGIINPRLMKITFDDSKINPYFFKYLFSLDQMLDVVKSYSHGGTMGIVNVGIIKNIMIIVPPLRLQEAFIEILDTVLVIKNQHRQAINSNLFEALQNQAFSGTL